MSDNTKLVYGIDLGTTYSCVAQINEHNEPEVKRNKAGDSVTPSVVHIDGNKIIVGKDAKRKLNTDPEKTIAYIKREMSNNESFKDTSRFPGRKNPVEISAEILKKLVKDVNEQYKQDIQDVVITCPAYFGSEARARTQKAGEEAGLNVLAIISEPTAAAISYVKNIDEDQVIMVYDLGGGTFDVSIIRFNDGAIEVIATGGDHKLGGADWDMRLAQELLDAYNEEHEESRKREGKTPIKLTLEGNDRLKNKLLIEVEETKKSLTDNDEATAELQYDGVSTSIEITRKRFDELTEILLNRTIDIVEKTLKDAEKATGIKKDNIDKVLLVGGSSRMQQVKEKVEEVMSKKPEPSENPDQIVAEGAAIYAVREKYFNILKQWEEDKKEGKADDSDKPQMPTIAGKTLGGSITNITSKTYGMGCLAHDDKRLIVSNIIFKNTKLPAKMADSFFTIEDNQKAVSLNVYESNVTDKEKDRTIEIDAANKLGKNRDDYLELTKDYPKGTEIIVEFEINNNGILSVRAYVKNYPNDKVNFELAIEGI